MITLHEDCSAASGDTVDRLGQPYTKTLHAPRQAAFIGRFHDKVEVGALHRILREPCPETLFAAGQGLAHRRKGPALPQIADALPNP